MEMFDMRHHITFLIKSHFTAFKRAREWLIIRMYALMREEFVQTPENFHAWALT